MRPGRWSNIHWYIGVATCFLLPNEIAGTSQPLPGGVHLPIIYHSVYGHGMIRRSVDGQGVSGLGDFEDISYSVLVKLGLTTVTLLVDTGSSDLWALSDACKNCSNGLPTFPHKRLNYSGVDARLFYGDSFNGQYAFGPIGSATVQLANLSISQQYFAAINDTTTTTTSTLSVGLLGLGFPESSAIWNALFNHQYPSSSKTTTSLTSSTRSSHSSTTVTSVKRSSHRPRSLARISSLVDLASGMQSLATVDQLLKTFITYGPLVARMSFSGLLKTPSFTLTLQRDSVQIGGNAGLLSLGELPPGVSNSSLTWAQVRGYTVQEGGIPPSPAAPNETYSLFWEIPIDNVYLDGTTLPQSTLSTGVSLSALVDTGSSLLRGPTDVVASIYKQISGDDTSPIYDCSTPHILEFEISGVRFPVDPRDFGWQAFPNSVQKCNASVVGTDPPSKGFLYAWSLGVPFLKSVLASFHYGNLTNPSVDPPRIGFVSTMPSDAQDLLAQAIKAANPNFPGMLKRMKFCFVELRTFHSYC
ncbi:acid protease [Clavulina sp. PMI_390]|nr:acid protease [Clavulina sp. PMI_390]